MNEDSLFTKIIKGEIPCHKVHEDEKTFAFMDIRPIQPGQILVVPKSQVEFVWDLNEEDYQALLATVRLAALKIRQEFPEKSHVATIIEGLEVAHAHIKVFPFNDDSEFRRLPAKDERAADDELATLASRLSF